MTVNKDNVQLCQDLINTVVAGGGPEGQNDHRVEEARPLLQLRHFVFSASQGLYLKILCPVRQGLANLQVDQINVLLLGLAQLPSRIRAVATISARQNHRV